LQTSAFHPVYLDSNPHLNWPFSVLCGQLELKKLECPVWLFLGFRYIKPTLYREAVFSKTC
jgi:hypothetical protein